MIKEYVRSINNHYSQVNLGENILAAHERAGKVRIDSQLQALHKAVITGPTLACGVYVFSQWAGLYGPHDRQTERFYIQVITAHPVHVNTTGTVPCLQVEGAV